MVLIALFTDRWLDRSLWIKNPTDLAELGKNVGDLVTSIKQGEMFDMTTPHIGLFTDCTTPDGAFFEGECVPNLDDIETIFTNWDGEIYPHAWRGAILCFTLGLFVCVVTDLFALLTICCRSCICCSVFTICGTLQSFASILFTLGMLAYAAGWGSEQVAEKYCGKNSHPFVLGDSCKLGDAFWLALAGTVCTVLASSLAIWAYQSTRSNKAEELQSQGDRCICLA